MEAESEGIASVSSPLGAPRVGESEEDCMSAIGRFVKTVDYTIAFYSVNKVSTQKAAKKCSDVQQRHLLFSDKEKPDSGAECRRRTRRRRLTNTKEAVKCETADVEITRIASDSFSFLEGKENSFAAFQARGQVYISIWTLIETKSEAGIVFVADS